MNNSYKLVLWSVAMSRLFLTIITLVGGLYMAPTTKGQDVVHDLKNGICIPDCIKKWCRDDYCPKPVPCPVPVKCFGCSCYHPKKLPSITCVKCFRCDDYCPKPLPSVCKKAAHSMKIASPLYSETKSTTEDSNHVFPGHRPIHAPLEN